MCSKVKGGESKKQLGKVNWIGSEGGGKELDWGCIVEREEAKEARKELEFEEGTIRLGSKTELLELREGEVVWRQEEEVETM